MREGVFDRLQGEGEPLDRREDPFEDPALRMAHRLLRNNGFAPAWIEESREIEAEIVRLRAFPEPGRVEALNRRILAFNLKAPSPSLHKQPFRPDSTLA